MLKISRRQLIKGREKVFCFIILETTIGKNFGYPIIESLNYRLATNCYVGRKPLLEKLRFKLID